MPAVHTSGGGGCLPAWRGQDEAAVRVLGQHLAAHVPSTRKIRPSYIASTQ